MGDTMSPEMGRGPDKGVFKMVTKGATRHASSPPIATPDKRPRVKIKQPEETGSRGQTAARIAAAILLAETAGATVTELRNEQPISPQTIVADVMWPYTAIEGLIKQEPPIPLEFNPDLDKSSLGSEVNTIATPQEQLKIAYNQQVEENKDSGRPTVLFPVAFTASGQRVDYEYQAPLTNGIDSVTGQVVIQERPGTINTTYERGEIISLAMENAEVFQFKPATVNGKEYFQGFFIKFQQNGELFGLRIAQSDVKTFQPLIDTSNIPFVPEGEGGGLLLTEAKDGAKLPMLTNLISINTDNPQVILNFNRYNPKTGRWESVKPNFVVGKSNERTKLLIAQPNQ